MAKPSKKVSSTFEEILALLDHMSRRPGMYVGKLEVATIQAYLHGLRAGCSLAGLDLTKATDEKAAAMRGWKWRAAGIVWHMQKKKLTDEEKVRELIAVEIEFYRLAFAPDS